MPDASSYETDGFILRRNALAVACLERLVEIGEGIHARWLDQQGEEAQRHRLLNSHGLTASRYFPAPHRQVRALFFDALASEVLYDILAKPFGETLCFHGTQMFFHPVGGPRKPYWHRDFQYTELDEAEHRATYEGNRDRLTLDLLLAKPHPRLPVKPDPDQLPDPGEMKGIRHPRWYENALALIASDPLDGPSRVEPLADADRHGRHRVRELSRRRGRLSESFKE